MNPGAEWIGALAIGFFAVAAVSGSQEPAPTLRLRDTFSGSLEQGLDVAGNDRDHDVELSQVLRLQVEPRSAQQTRIVSSAWIVEDLDGNESDTSYLRSLAGSNDESVDFRLLTLYLERSVDQGRSVVRAGRQRIEEGVVYNRIDGLYVRIARPKVTWYGFGGSRASVYDYSLHEIAGGGGVRLSLPTRTQARVDFYYGEEVNQPGEFSDTESLLSSVSVTQALTLRHYLDGRVTWSEDGLDEYWISARGVLARPEIVYNVTYRSKQSVRSERVSDISDFVRILGELNDYTDLSSVVSIPFTSKVALSLQAQLHDAEDASVASGNRDFERYGVSLDLTDLRKQYDATVGIDFWDADGGENQITVTGEITRKWKSAEATLGTSFDQFQDRILLVEPTTLTPLTVDSREDVYTYYAEYLYDWNERHRISARASLEKDDGPDSPQWWLRAAYTMRF